MIKILTINQIGLILIVVLISFTGCNPFRNRPVNIEVSKGSIEDFDLFYDRFVKDSLFQMSRLKFPLKGCNEDGNEWTKENWITIKTKIFDVDTTLYKVFYQRDKNSFIEKVWIEDSGFSSEQKFDLINNKWFLVFAFELNN